MAVGGDGGGGGGGDDDEHTVSTIKILSHYTLAYRLTRSLTDWPLVTSSSSSSPADICKTIYNFNVFCTPVRDRIYICRSNNNRNQLANANEKKEENGFKKKHTS